MVGYYGKYFKCFDPDCLAISGAFQVIQKIVVGIEVERKVLPGEKITLFCDCSMHGDQQKWQLSYIVWFRNCSHVHQPPLQLSSISKEYPPRLRLIKNLQNKSYDLEIDNITQNDLGLYYCAYMRKAGKTSKEEYGTLSTRVTFEGKSFVKFL